MPKSLIIRTAEPDQTRVLSHALDPELVKLRRKQIVEAAIKLFADQGYYKTTVQDIARKAKISTGLIYHYASTKEDILLLSLLSVLESYKRELPPAIERSKHPLERLFNGLAAYCRVVDASKQATVLAYRSTKSLPKHQRKLVMQSEIETNALIEACLSECVKEGLFRDVALSLTTYHFVNYAHAWALKYWRLRALTTHEAYIRHGFDFFAHALTTPKGWRQYQRLRDRLVP